MASAEKTTGRPKRVELPQLWDDTVFRKRLATLAERKGVSVRQAMKEIGLTPAYVYRGTDARTTNLLMVVADYFKVSPSYVAGWTSDPDVEREPHQAEAEEPHTHSNGLSQPSEEASHLIEKLAEIFSQQTLKMLFITLAITRPDVDPKALAELASIDWDAMIGKKKSEKNP
ncbi:MAG TPA: hypothetical protein VNH19_05025 [Candidatus Limnocylindrales bacterium]|nr:hypothetical protein [Candidatus Limnocylindrales bacterium]